MARYVVSNGAVTSWAGNGNADLISGPSAPSAYTLTVQSPEQEVTAFDSSGVTSADFLRSIEEWSASIESRYNPASVCDGSLVTFAGGYAQHVRAFDLTIQADVRPTTAFNSAGVTARTFVPSIIRWSGTYEAHADTTNALILPKGATIGAATFKLVEDGSDDHTLAGSIVVTNMTAPVQVGEVARATYTFRGTGDLTAAGTGGSAFDDNIFDYWIANNAGVIARPPIGSLVLTSTTSRTYTGDAFWSSINIRAAIGEILSVGIQAQGTGPLTVA